MASQSSSKSHVGMGIHVCPVCLKEHDEVVVLDRRLANTLERYNFMGWELCPEHQQKFDEGYIAVIECNNKPRNLEEADRTGVYMLIRGEIWNDIFNMAIPEKRIAFCPPEVTQILKTKMGSTFDESVTK